MEGLKNYISRSTKYDMALQLLKENGFTEVYCHEFDNTFESYKGVKEHLHIFYKYSVVAVLETFGGNQINTFEIYVQYSNPQGYIKNAYIQSGNGKSAVFKFPYNVFDMLELLNRNNKLATYWTFEKGNEHIRIMDWAETNADGKYPTSSIIDGSKHEECDRRFSTLPDDFLKLINYKGINNTTK